MRKIIGIASSDYHLHNFPDFNEGSSRFGWALTAMQYIANQALINNVPSLFTGDLFHNPRDVDNDIIGRTLMAYEDMYERNKIPFIAIDGNHDQKEKNTMTNRSPQYLKAFQHFKTMHSAPQGTSKILYYDSNSGTGIWGLPYYTYEKDWIAAIKEVSKLARVSSCKHKILLLHGNAPNAKTTTGQTIEDCMLPQDLDNFFKDWDLVLFGHIHRPQKLSKKCYMLGSHIQQNRGDEGCEMGYWEIYSDMTMKFKSLNKRFPTFRTQLHATQTGRFPKDIDYIIPSAGTGLPDETTEDGDPGTRKAFRNLADRKALSKAYCRTKGINDKDKRHALTQILNQV